MTGVWVVVWIDSESHEMDELSVKRYCEGIAEKDFQEEPIRLNQPLAL